jgi:hypothetical protein
MKVLKQIYRNFTDNLQDRFDTQLKANVSNFVTDEDNNPLLQLTADIEGDKTQKLTSLAFSGSAFLEPVGSPGAQKNLTYNLIDFRLFPAQTSILNPKKIERIKIKDLLTFGVYTTTLGSGNVVSSFNLFSGSSILLFNAVNIPVGTAFSVGRHSFNFDFEVGLKELINSSNAIPGGIGAIRIQHRLQNGSGLGDVTVTDLFTIMNIEYVLGNGEIIQDQVAAYL